MILKKYNILMIADQFNVLIEVKEKLNKLLPNAQVFTESSEQEGINTAKKENPDVIILDFMPHKTAFDICRTIKEDQDLRFIPVLFFRSSKFDLELSIKALDSGTEGFISKPIDEPEFLAQILTMIKIKAGNLLYHQEKAYIEELVTQRTKDIQQELINRRKIEKALTISELRFRRLFETAKIGILILNAEDGKILNINPYLTEILGCTKDRMIDSVVWETDQFKDIISNHHEFLELQYKLNFSDDLIIRTFDGKSIEIEFNCNVYYVETQKVIQCNIQDITNRKKAEKELAYSHELMRYIIEHDRGTVVVYDRNMNYVYVSQRYLQEYIPNDKDIIGKNVYEVLPQIPPKWRDVHNRCLSGEIISAEADWNIRPNGSIAWNAWECRPWYTADGSIGGIIIYTEIITERKKAELELIESKEKYKSIFDQAPIGIALVDSITGQLYNVNRKYAEITGRSVEELFGKDWMSITHPDDLEADLAFVAQMNVGEITGFTLNKRYIKPDGSTVWASKNIAQIRSEGKNPCHLCMIVDISEQIEKEKRIEYLYYHDILTGLYNRTFFEEKVDQLDNEDQFPLSIIIGDINGLKLINDGLGHAEGDKFLVEMAKILTKCCSNNEIVARVGGDEFSILLPKTTSEETQHIQDCIYAACKKYNEESKNDSIYLSISLGHATKNNKNELYMEISKNAEDNMYRRKLLEHKSVHSSIISSIKMTLFEKSHETEEHAERLVLLSRTLGTLLGLKEEKLSELELLAALHDIGKIAVDDAILTKPGKLTQKEWQEMKKHPSIGYRIAMASPELSHIADYILSHHERWDGKGYPQGLRGENIPLFSRILAIVDSYDAMTEVRSYRNAISVEEVLAEIKRNAGTQFDPYIADIFIKMIRGENI